MSSVKDSSIQVEHRRDRVGQALAAFLSKIKLPFGAQKRYSWEARPGTVLTHNRQGRNLKPGIGRPGRHQLLNFPNEEQRAVCHL